MSESDLPQKDIQPFVDPASTAMLFLLALDDTVENERALYNVTTPESWAAWGDFRAAQAMIQALGKWGVQSIGQRAVNDDGVAYIGVIRDAESNFVADGDVLLNCAAVVSLVQRPALGGWLVHGIGGYIPAEDMPRD